MKEYEDENVQNTHYGILVGVLENLKRSWDTFPVHSYKKDDGKEGHTIDIGNGFVISLINIRQGGPLVVFSRSCKKG